MQHDENILATGQTVRVEYNDCSGKVCCHQAKVGTLSDNVIELLFELKELPILSHGAGVILACQPDQNRPTLFYKCSVTDVYFGKAAIYVSDLNPIDMTVLRKHIRCDVNFAVKLEIDETIYGGHARNISAGGMFVGMPLRDGFAVGRRLTCHFSLPGFLNPMIVRGEIVRVERIETERMGIAIRFLSLHEKNQNDIIQYIYRCQRDMMKKRTSSK
jgi:hypothetical protein